MRSLGSATDILNIVYKRNGQDVTLQPNASTTFSAPRTFSLPNVDANRTLAAIGLAQSFSALQTFQAGLLIDGGTTNNYLQIATGGTKGTGKIVYTTTTGFNINNSGLIVANSTGSATHAFKSTSSTVLRIDSGPFSATESAALALGANGQERFWFGYDLATATVALKYDASATSFAAAANTHLLITAGGAVTMGPASGTFNVAHKAYISSGGNASGSFSVDSVAAINSAYSNEFKVSDAGNSRAVLLATRAGGTTESVGCLALYEDGVAGFVYIWAKAGVLRYSTNGAHIGTANGNAV